MISGSPTFLLLPAFLNKYTPVEIISERVGDDPPRSKFRRNEIDRNRYLLRQPRKTAEVIDIL